MVVAHLRVFLDTEGVLLVTANGQAALVNRDHAIAGGTLEDVKLNHGGLGGRDDFELRETHLEHHVVRQGHFLPHHNKGAGSRADIAQVKVGQVAVA